MVKFVEYKSNPWWATLLMLCWFLVIPLLAVILFLQEVISTIGLVVIVACGMVGNCFLYEQVKRRSRIAMFARSGPVFEVGNRT